MYQVDELKLTRLRQAHEVLQRATLDEWDGPRLRVLLCEDERLTDVLNAVDDLLK